MNKAYDKITWQNTPSTATPLGATNLNKMSDALDTIDDRVIALDENKSSVSISGTLESGDTIANITIDGTTTSIKSTQITVDSQLSPTSENPVQNKVVQGAFVETASHIVSLEESKADKNGEITSAKTSYSLLCDTPVNDNAPYTYRQFPATNAKLEKLKKLTGASVVWNQLLVNGNFADTSYWGVQNCTITASNNILTATYATLQYRAFNVYRGNLSNLIKDHVVLIFATAKANMTEPFTFQFDGGGTLDSKSVGNLTSNFVTYSAVIKLTNNQTKFTLNVQKTNATDELVVDYKNVYYTDLTAMFGTTIADYVNTLETTQAGSGIAWLQKYGFFTEEYCAYSANTIQSVSVSGHKIVRKNRLKNDGYHSISVQGVQYTKNADGSVTAYGTVTSGQTSYYVFTNSSNSLDTANNTAFKKGMSVITPTSLNLRYKSGSYSSISANTATTLTDDVACIYKQFGGGTAVNTTIYPIICFSNVEDLTYEPYTEETTALDHTEQRGIFYLDNGELKVDGDIYNANGSGSVRYKEITFDGSSDENWQLQSTNQYGIANFQIVLSELPTSDNAIASNGFPLQHTPIGSTQDEGFLVNGGQLLFIRIKSTTASNETQFKTYLSNNPLTIIYEKATPTTATLTPFNELSALEQGGTEEFIDYGVQQSTRDVAIPCGTDTDFYQGLSLPALPTSGGKVELTYDPTNRVFSWE